MLRAICALFCLFFALSGHGESYLGNSAQCGQCHAKQYQQWQHSHHDQAMQVANSNTVLADFNNISVDYFGEKTTFLKKDGVYYIRTPNQHGKLTRYKVVYTFGVHPLQQYLIQLPNGKLQAFTIAWDVVNKKWFHLYPDEHITADNPLHWSNHFFTWNVSCAECHSTNLKKNYNAKTKTYHTSYSEINVGCQSCHGPGAAHIAWANKKNRNANTPQIVKSPTRKIDQCASCHSRRHPVSVDDPYGGAFLDHFMPALLRSDLYYPDGQIKDEVYVYGSFLQSKMHQKGVTCMDCHNPHSLQLIAKGDALCLQCHSPKGNPRFATLVKKDYNTTSHHHHQLNSAGSKCVNCHMPETTYMKVDPRRDHRFGSPRPDLTITLGVPNACNRCHRNKSAQWAQQYVEKWYGKKIHQNKVAPVFAKAYANKLTSAKPLIAIAQNNDQAAIVRATAAQLLLPYQDKKTLQVKVQLLHDKNALVRAAAVRSLASMPITIITPTLLPLLQDPVRAVRIEVAGVLAGAPQKLIPPKKQAAFNRVMQEYKALQESNRDLASGYFNLGNFYHKRGEQQNAITQFEHAIALDDSFYPAFTNLATVYQLNGDSKNAVQVLRRGIKANQDQGELYYATGLLLAEQNNMKDAVAMLATAAKLQPNNVRVNYNYALALQKVGDVKTAEQVLVHTLSISNNNADVLYALAVFYSQQKRWQHAKYYANKLQQIIPQSREVQRLVRYLNSQPKP